MNRFQDQFVTGENFPKELPVPQRTDVLEALATFGIDGADSIRLIDSTHDSSDVRLNYIVDKRWVLRFCIAPGMTEKRLHDLEKLVERYQAMGIRCPRFLTDSWGRHLHNWQSMQYYLTEYIDLPLAGEEDIRDKDRLLSEVQAGVARFAEKNRDISLSSTMGMYSLFDLSPFDAPNGMDEKEDNFNQLIGILRKEKENRIADMLILRHAEIREKLRAVYRKLPRCVFQGDENFSNILTDDEQHFAGFIDFNMAGTEVVVNQMVNLVGFDYDEKHTEPEGAYLRLNKALLTYQERMRSMLHIYRTSEGERQALVWYAWIVMISQWPILCYFRKAIQGKLKAEILELLSLIASLPEEQLAVI